MPIGTVDLLTNILCSMFLFKKVFFYIKSLNDNPICLITFLKDFISVCYPKSLLSLSVNMFDYIGGVFTQMNIVSQI